MLFILFLLSLSLSVEAQHPSCKVIHSGQTLECLEGGYSLPSSFNTSIIPGKNLIQYIGIEGRRNHGQPDLVPLPTMAALRSVSLRYFNEISATPFPFSRFLANNKANIGWLRFTDVKLVNLTAADMAGFNSLYIVEFLNNQLASIDKDVFSDLGRLPSGVLIPNFKPQLTTLEIRSSPELKAIDWGFLAPLTDSLESLYFTGHGIESVVSSKTFHFTKAVQFLLDRNRLITIPLAIVETLTQLRSEFRASFFGNSICQQTQDGDCSCCELASFGEWYRKNTNLQVVSLKDMTLSCGKGGYLGTNKLVSVAVFRNSSLHQQCEIPAPTTAPTIEPQPEPEIPNTPNKPIAPCQAVAPLRASCSKGIFTKPSVDLDYVEATDFELTSDITKKSSAIAYDLHTWLLERAQSVRRWNSPARSDAGIVATCRGAGEVTVHELDPDTVESNNVTFKTSTTPKCRELYFDFLQYLLSL